MCLIVDCPKKVGLRLGAEVTAPNLTMPSDDRRALVLQYRACIQILADSRLHSVSWCALHR
jgi:hypothetical protein